METGVACVVGWFMLAGAAAAQPLELVASQPPVAGVPGQASQQTTGAQTIEAARVLIDDFVAQEDAVANRVRLYAHPTTNAYMLRLRLIEIDDLNNEIAELAAVSAGVQRITVDALGGDTGDKLTVYELDLAGGVGLRVGTRYGIEAVAQLTSPTLGDETGSWKWAGADGDGSMLIETDGELRRLDHPGAAFEVLGEVLTPACLADVNEDGVLTPADFNAWIQAFNARDTRADQNGDGAITPADFNAWIINYSAGC